jgi:hypothetical protein
MADYIRPTPRNPILGLLADAMMGGLSYMEDPRRTQQLQGLAGLLSDTGIAQTVDRLASGEPLTKGKGFATKMKPETAAAAMTLGPEAVPIGRGAMAAVRATKGLPVGMGIKPINLADAVFKPELTMKEMQLVKDIPTVQRVQASIDLVGEKKFQEMVESQFKKYKPTDQDQEAMLVESVTLDILGRTNRQPELLQGLPGLRTPAPQEETLRLAQQGAGSENYLASLRKVDVFGNANKIDYYDDANNLMYSATKVPSGFKWSAFDVKPIEQGGNQVIGGFMAHKSFDDAVKSIRGARISASAKAKNEKYAVIPNTWKGEEKKLAKMLIDADVGIDRFSSSTQSKSKYIYLDDGRKIRIADHALPTNYDAPEYDFRYGGDVKSLVARIIDPTRRNEPDLLAGALPFTALLDEENRARLEEQLGGLLGP